MVSQLLYGDCFKIISTKENWIEIFTIQDKYAGWIFKNEFQHKQAFGTQKLMLLFERYQVTERLDEYRTNLVKSRWRRIFG